MITQIPGGSGKPHLPPPITPKEVGNKEETKPAPKHDAGLGKVSASKSDIGRGPELDARALAVRLSALASEAKEKEISSEEFERILEEAIQLTGIKDGQAALEEANRRLQKEIETELEKIKASKELMEEADDWQKFAELLAAMGQAQAEAFVSMMKDSIHEL